MSHTISHSDAQRSLRVTLYIDDATYHTIKFLFHVPRAVYNLNATTNHIKVNPTCFSIQRTHTPSPTDVTGRYPYEFYTQHIAPVTTEFLDLLRTRLTGRNIVAQRPVTESFTHDALLRVFFGFSGETSRISTLTHTLPRNHVHATRWISVCNR